MRWPVEFSDASVCVEKLHSFDKTTLINVPDLYAPCSKSWSSHIISISFAEFNWIYADSSPDIMVWLTLISYIFYVFAERNHCFNSVSAIPHIKHIDVWVTSESELLLSCVVWDSLSWKHGASTQKNFLQDIVKVGGRLTCVFIIIFLKCIN